MIGDRMRVLLSLKKSVGNFFQENFFPIAVLWVVMFGICKIFLHSGFSLANDKLMLKLFPSTAEAFADSSALGLMALAGCLIIFLLFIIRNICVLNTGAKNFHNKYSLRVLNELSAALVQVGCGIAFSAYLVNQPSIWIWNNLLYSSLISFFAAMVMYCAYDLLKTHYYRLEES